MTAYTNILVAVMAKAAAPDAWHETERKDGTRYFTLVLSDKEQARALREARAALIAQLKFMIEQGPSEGMVKASLLEADKHGYFATRGYYTEGEADYTCRAQCRALLAELEGP